jgi:hypothetical protein
VSPVDKRRALARLCAAWRSGVLPAEIRRTQAQAAMVLIAENLWLRDQVPDSQFRMMFNDARGLPLVSE